MPIHFEGWGSLNDSSSDSFRRVYLGETSHQMAGMQTEQRIKRQNCGNNMPMHHNLTFGSRDQIGSRFAVENGDAEESMSYPVRVTSSGFYGLTGECSRTLHERNFQLAEPGSSSSSGFPTYHDNHLRIPAPDRETVHYQGRDQLGNYTSTPNTQSQTGNRCSYKRKSSMDDVTGSVRPFDFGYSLEQRERESSWFTEEATSSRINSTIPRFISEFGSITRIPLGDDPSHPSDSNLVSQPLRSRPLRYQHLGSNGYFGRHYPNGLQESCQAPLQGNSSTGSPDAMIAQSAQIPHEASHFNQDNFSSAVIPWSGNGIVSAHNHGIQRNLNAGVNIRSQTRNCFTGASSRTGIPYWLRNTFQPYGRTLPGFPYGYRAFSSQGLRQPLNRHAYSNHIPSFHSSAASSLSGHDTLINSSALLPHRAPASNLTLGSHEAPGNTYRSYGFLNRPTITPPFRAPTQNIGASAIANHYGVPFRGLETLPSYRGSGHRFTTHETVDHALVYNGYDIQDQHLGLQQPDVDNMSYEELLALEERIGNVNTGLSEENIHQCLKTSEYSHGTSVTAVSEESDIKCSICQEEYVEGDEIGHLNCNHSYHTVCIKQWLVLKNQCPICKAAAA
ncbi:hypothetical protein KP509_1Z049900 [Ceratopteris richardii]|nr:hypothetical protein KP509_1Z049900 [Ceratopteris richardii]KAH6558694.1 hypothetical protein KP509_1Z049900 [Ceratopteris richardii]